MRFVRKGSGWPERCAAAWFDGNRPGVAAAGGAGIHPRPVSLCFLLVLLACAGCTWLDAGEKALEETEPGDHPWSIPAERLAGGAASEAILAPDASPGVAVYRGQYCGLCHRFDRAGTAGRFGPPHDGFAAIAEARIQSDAYTGEATTAAEYVRESILDPDAYVVPGYVSRWSRMPAYADLTAEDLEALVQLLLEEE